MNINKQLGFKLVLSTLSILGLFTMTSNEIFAAPVTKTSDADFELTSNDDGIELSASDIIFESMYTFKTGRKATLQSNTSIIKINEYSGRAPEWNLTVQLDDFIGSKPENKLKGAKLKIPVTAVTAISDFDTITAANIKPQMEEVVLNPGLDSKRLMSSEIGKGYGEWQAEFKNLEGKPGEERPMELSMISGNLADTYVAKLTYTIETVPVIETW